MKKFFDDYPAAWPELLNVFWTCGKISSMCRHVPNVSEIWEGVFCIPRKSPRRLCERFADKIRQLKVIAISILDLIRDTLAFECLDYGDFDDSAHHDASSIMPTRSKAAVHLATNGHKVTTFGFRENAKRKQAFVLEKKVSPMSSSMYADVPARVDFVWPSATCPLDRVLPEGRTRW